MKKVLRILGLSAVAAIGSAGLAAWGDDGEKADLKIGMVCIGDPDESTYDANFKDALEATKAKYDAEGYKIETQYWVAKGEDADARAAAEEACDSCDIVLLNSYGHQFFGDAVATNNPDVKVVSCTGDTAALKKIPNFYNAFANIYEGRYLAGIAAGMKLNAIGSAASDHVLGYVAAFPYAEVISGYTAFYLGAKSVCPDVTMKYTVTNSWGDESAEFSGAASLISAGCKVISQHADTYGAPNKCNALNVPNVSYNVSANKGSLASTYLCSSRINWTPYFNYLVEQTKNNATIAYDWAGGIKEGSVVVGDLGSCAASGTKEAIDSAAEKIKNGSLKVFDCSKFTVTVTQPDAQGKGGVNVDATVDENGHLTAYKADLDGDYKGDTNVVTNGVFEESTKRSAPYFNCQIDGITCIDAAN